MKRLVFLAGFCIVLIASGCSGRISHEQSERTGSSKTFVEISRLDPPPPVPTELSSDPQPLVVGLEGNGVIIFGDVVENHHHLHFHEGPEPPNLRIDVRLQFEAIDTRERRQQTVERRLTELQGR